MSTEDNTSQRSKDPSRARVTAITSGKGGVGKTFLAANLASALARRGNRVLVLDADLGLANLDVVLNLSPKVTLHEVFTGKVEIEQAVMAAPGGFSVVLAGSGMVEYSRLTPEVRVQLLDVLERIAPHFDHIILDTGAGISDVVLYSVSLADDVIVVTTPEPTSLTDAYATIKVLAGQQHRRVIKIVVNQVSRSGEGRVIRGQLQLVIDKFVSQQVLGEGNSLRLELIGEIPTDSTVREAVQKRRLLIEEWPGCPAANHMRLIAEKFVQ